MAVTVETLEKLKRRVTLTVNALDINNEVQTRLRKLSRTIRADGFRPGKVPMSVVAQRHGYAVQYEVVNDRIGEAFSQAASVSVMRRSSFSRVSTLTAMMRTLVA